MKNLFIAQALEHLAQLGVVRLGQRDLVLGLGVITFQSQGVDVFVVGGAGAARVSPPSSRNTGACR